MKLTDLGLSFDPEAMTEDEMTLLMIFKGFNPDEPAYLEDMFKAFAGRVVELENAQLSLAQKGFLRLIRLPNVPGRLDRVQQAVLTLDGYRKLQEINR